NPVPECGGFVDVAAGHECVQGQARIAKPAEAIVPVPYSAEGFGQRRCRRCIGNKQSNGLWNCPCSIPMDETRNSSTFRSSSYRCCRSCAPPTKSYAGRSPAFMERRSKQTSDSSICPGDDDSRER